MKAKKISPPLAQFPEQIRTYLEGANFYDSSSHSGANVFYADTGYYLKIDQKDQLTQEATLAKWFEKQGLGVPIIHYQTTDKDYLLTKEAEGKNALAFLQQPEELCQTMAAALKKLHNTLSFSFLAFPPKMFFRFTWIASSWAIEDRKSVV